MPATVTLPNEELVVLRNATHDGYVTFHRLRPRCLAVTASWLAQFRVAYDGRKVRSILLRLVKQGLMEPVPELKGAFWLTESGVAYLQDWVKREHPESWRGQ